MNKRITISASVALGTGLLLAIGAPLAASAHVSLQTNTAAAGSYSIITFKVPNESDTAGTDKVVLNLPADTPFASVSYIPVAGWTAELNEEKLATPVKVGESEITDAVTSVTWTADDGSEITPGQLQLFSLSVGPVPETGSIVLPAEQYYDDGTVVEWSSTEEDAEYPAPVLYVNDAAPADHHGGAATEADEAEHSEAAASTTVGSDVLARVLGIGGLIVGAIGIVLAVTARRTSADATTDAIATDVK
jgi:uncharacterized protein YcnI